MISQIYYLLITILDYAGQDKYYNLAKVWVKVQQHM